MRAPTLACINCHKQRRCLLIQVSVPLARPRLNRNAEQLAGVWLDRLEYYEESLRLAICRRCLDLPHCPLASYILEGV